jgi:hypothetical protein
MQFFTRNLFIFPENTPRPPELSDDPGCIELTDAEFTDTPPQLGDRFHSISKNSHNAAKRFDWVPFAEIDWVAVKILVYEPLDLSSYPTQTAYEVWYVHPDENGIPERQGWSDNNRYYDYFGVTTGEQRLNEDGWIPSGFVWDLKNLPRVGKSMQDYPDWKVSELQRFSLVGTRPTAGFDEIVLCWCSEYEEARAPQNREPLSVIPFSGLEMPIIPKPGEVFLYVSLSEVKNMTVTETIAMLEEMGYSPELRYRQSKEDGAVSIYALLKHEQYDPDSIEGFYPLHSEWETLARKIKPTLAVCCPRGLPRQMEAISVAS